MERHDSNRFLVSQWYSLPLPALSHWEVELEGTSMEEVRGARFAGVRHSFLLGSRRPSMLMLVRSAAALATELMMI